MAPCAGYVVWVSSRFLNNQNARRKLCPGRDGKQRQDQKVMKQYVRQTEARRNSDCLKFPADQPAVAAG